MKRLTLTVSVLLLTGALSAPIAVADDEPLGLSLHSLGEALMWYPANRANDLVDIIHASFGFGPGYALSVRATNQLYLQAADYSALVMGFNEGGILPQAWDKELAATGIGVGPFQAGDFVLGRVDLTF